MTIRNLDKLFAAKSVALIGASDKEGSVGKTVAKNLLSGGFTGTVWFVNPKHETVLDQTCYSSIAGLPEAPDLAILATPAKAVPGLISELGKKGTRAAVVISAGMREHGLQQAMLEAAKPYCFRIVGPNCIGVLMPKTGLNASFAQAMPQKGNLAFISQSGALLDATLDWANGRNIGFSTMISMGDMADVDVGDLLDYLATDTETHAILMYLEQVTNPRKFMSAARSASRIKPVIVVKSGRHEAAAKAALSHTGALAGSDQVYDAAFRRAGIVRVEDLEDLFDAAEVLSRTQPVSGERLAIVTNGGGAGVLAVDELMDKGGTLANLSEKTIKQLDKALPPTWSKANPVDLIGDAGPERYEAALTAVLADPGVDAVLVMNCPTALASSTEAATAVTKAVRELETHKTVLTCWLGNQSATAVSNIFWHVNIPTFSTPADAIRGFTYLTSHHKARMALRRSPPLSQKGFKPDETAARDAMRPALESGRELLNEMEAKAVLSAFGIPVVATLKATTPAEVRSCTEEILKTGAREVVIKVLSPDVTHKSDVGGVVLGLSNPESAESAAKEMLQRIKDVPVEGFTVQPMIRRPHAQELIVGMAEDKTFGPVILFGTGGTAVEVIGDRALALPPLDSNLARELVETTRAYKLLRGYRNHPPVNMEAITQALTRISQMTAMIPEIFELDINPLLADETGVIALDARIVVRKTETKSKETNPRFSIRPYPQQWEKSKKLKNGKTVLLRPIKPEDEELLISFIQKSDPEDVRQRLFHSVRSLSHETAALLTQIDYARTMAFIAIDEKNTEMLGITHLLADPDYDRAEYAVMTRSDIKQQGIGTALTDLLVDYARSEGIGELWGQVMRDNAAMLKICHTLGIQVTTDNDDPVYLVATLPLRDKSLKS